MSPLSPLFASRHKIADRLSRKLQINVHYFARNSAIVSINYALSVLSGLITGYLVARLLPADLYGGYRFGLAVTGVVSMITLPELETALARDIATKGPAGTPLRHTLFLNGLMCLAGALILIGLIPFLGTFWNQSQLAPLFVVMAVLFIPLQIAATFYSSIITGTGEFKRTLPVNMLGTALVVVLLPVVLYFTYSLPLLYLVAVGLPGLVVLGAFIGQLPRFPSRDRSSHIIRFGTLLSLNTIPLTIASQLDSFIIAGCFGLKQLALFQVAILIPEQVKVWFKSLMPVSFSRLATLQDSHAHRRKMIHMVGLLTAVVGAGVAVYIVLAPFIYAWLFPNYAQTDIVWLSRLSAAMLVTVPATLFAQYLEAHGMIRSLQIANWTSAVIFVVALVTLVPAWGLTGAIVARALLRGTFSFINLISLIKSPLIPHPTSA